MIITCNCKFIVQTVYKESESPFSSTDFEYHFEAGEHDPMKESYELHFRDGFQNTLVDVLVDGKVQQSLDLTTKYQIGLADIAKLSIRPGQKVALRVDKGDRVEAMHLDPKQNFVCISKTETAVAIESMDESPGYI